MEQTEIIVTIVGAIISSGILNIFITHALTRSALKKEQKVGYENMLGEKIIDALIQVRELELQCNSIELYEPEVVFEDDEFDGFGNNAIGLTITEDKENFFKFMNEVSKLRRECEMYLGYEEAAMLYYMERYCQEFLHILTQYSVDIKLAGTIFIVDFQKWQKHYEKILVKRINNPKYKIYDKNKKWWEFAKKRVLKHLWNKSLLNSVKKEEDNQASLMVRAILNANNAEEGMRLFQKLASYNERHPIKSFFMKYFKIKL